MRESLALLLLRQHQRPVTRYRHGMLEVRAVAAIFGDRGPLVVQDARARLADIDHRLNRQHHAFAQPVPWPRVPKFGTCGSSCSRVPIPWPTNSRTTLKPLASTYSCTAAPTSPTVLPSLTSSIAFLSEVSVTSSSFCNSGASDLPTGTVIAESP